MQTDKLYINGQWVPSTGKETIEVINSSTEEVISTIPAGTADDVDRAVRAARDAFESWSQTSVADRAKFLRAIAEGLQERSAELVDLISKEVGSPTWFSALAQVGLPGIDVASVAEHHRGLRSSRRRWAARWSSSEPVGVVGAITPWNYPLHQITAKIAPALAVGCTVVVKPSEIAPLNAFILAEIIDSIGSATGRRVQPGDRLRHRWSGEALASHPEVDMISFTGSTRAGSPGQRVGLRRPSSGWPSSWAASRPTSSSTTPTWPRPSPTPWASATCQLGPDLLGAHPPGRAPLDRLAEVEEPWPRPGRRDVYHR